MMLRRLSLTTLLLLVTASAFAGLGWYGWGRVFGSGAELILEPGTLEFGSAIVGEDVDGLFVVTNPSREAVEIDGASTMPPFHIGDRAYRVPAGESLAVSVKFAPREPGEFHGELQLASKSFSGGERSLPLHALATLPAEIDVAPLLLSFGAVQVEGVSIGSLRVTNRGGAPLEVSPSVGMAFSASMGSALIAPGETQALEVYFRPTKERAYRTNLVIRSNDPRRNEVVVSLDGTGVGALPAPLVEVVPPALAFGPTPVGATAEQWVLLRNSGRDPLTIANITTQPPFQSASQSRTVAPGGTAPFKVAYSPDKVGRDSGVLSVYSNDPKQGMLNVALSAEAIDASDPRAAEFYSRQKAEAGTRAPGSVLDLIAHQKARGSSGSSGDSGNGDPAGDGTPQAIPRVEEGSQVILGSYYTDMNDYHVDNVRLDLVKGTLALEGVNLPVVDAGLSQYWEFDPTEAIGNLTPGGDVEMVLPVKYIGVDGVVTSMDVKLTTGEVRYLMGGSESALTGRPLGTDGTIRLVGTHPITNGAFANAPMRIILNVHVGNN